MLIFNYKYTAVYNWFMYMRNDSKLIHIFYYLWVIKIHHACRIVCYISVYYSFGSILSIIHGYHEWESHFYYSLTYYNTDRESGWKVGASVFPHTVDYNCCIVFTTNVFMFHYLSCTRRFDRSTKLFHIIEN